MKKNFVLSILLAMIVFAGCNSKTAISSASNAESAVSSSDTDSDISEEAVSTADQEDSSNEEDESEADNTGGEDYCYAHNWVYHSFDTELIEYVGWDNYNAWTASCKDTCSSNIVSFVQYFDIAKDELVSIEEAERAGMDDQFWNTVYEAFHMTQDEYFGSIMLSDEQIDAIYSGDESLIETVFSGALAADAEDGSRYSITWLENHTPEEYVEAGIQLESLEDMLTLIEEDDEYQKYRAEVSDISEQMTEAAAILSER